MDEDFRDKGLIIVGFPCNQFQGQEPKTCNLIIEDVRKEYGVRFPIMEKIDVNGDTAHPIFVYLRQNTYELKSKSDPRKILQIPWNFCRWIVDRRGRVQKYLNPSVQLTTAYDLVDALLLSQRE